MWKPSRINFVEMENDEVAVEISKPHVALYPIPGLGHLIPFLQLATDLVSYHGFTITLITSAWNASPLQISYVSELLASNPNTINHVALPEIRPDEDDTIDELQCLLACIRKSMSPVEETLRILQQPNHHFSPVRALITDLFCVDTLEVTDRLGLPNYIFFTSSASLLFLMFYAPQKFVWEKEGSISINIPGMKKPMSEGDLPDPFRDKSSTFDRFIDLCSRLQAVKAILVNTFHELEAHPIHALLSGKVAKIQRLPSIYAIGPIIRAADLAGVDSEKEKCLKLWLDKQPNASVVYAAFGTQGFMSREQVREIALGLESSGQRFVWTVRGIRNSNDMLELSSILPQGFLSRVEGRGLVLPSWAPQVAILSHPAIGAFLSHCGWNSTLEGIWYGVPMLAWPLYAEQRMNCLLIVNEWRVGLEVKKEAEGMVGWEELQSVMKEIMEGEEGRMVRKNMKEMSVKARIAVTPNQGSSFGSMEAACIALRNIT